MTNRPVALMTDIPVAGVANRLVAQMTDRPVARMTDRPVARTTGTATFQLDSFHGPASPEKSELEHGIETL